MGQPIKNLNAFKSSLLKIADPYNVGAFILNSLLINMRPRIIVDIFSDALLRKELAFRGGTALHKLFFNPAARYSEDIGLARSSTGSIKVIIDALRACLESWLNYEPSIILKNGPSNSMITLINFPAFY